MKASLSSTSMGLLLLAFPVARGVQPTAAQDAPDSVALPGVTASRSPDSTTSLVDVTELDSTLVLDIRYATPGNFTGRTLYPVGRCLLRPDAAERLVRVHARLKTQGLRLRIFDCYRPLSIQRRLWALVPDERYVADPATGSRHNRAAAVDLTLADSSGAELPMPTEYDDFTPRAHRDYQGATPEQLANRERLERAMEAEGFVGLPTEWWHFDAPGWERYPILDVPFTERAAPRRRRLDRAGPPRDRAGSRSRGDMRPSACQDLPAARERRSMLSR